MSSRLQKLAHPLEKLVISSALTVCLLISHAALAQSRGYTPRNPGPPPGSRTIAGTRSGSCAGNTATTLTALAPYSHVGKTSRTHPTFAWYVPDTEAFSLEFRLYTYETEENLQPQPIGVFMLSSTPGIMSFTLPQDTPGLVAGQRYYWQVALICDTAHPSEDLVVGTEIEVVDPTGMDESELWYDLLGTVLTDGVVDQSEVQLLTELAEMERSAGATAPSGATSSEGISSPGSPASPTPQTQQSEQLMQIIETIQ